MPIFEYSDNWVYSQYHSNINKIKANYIAKLITKIKKEGTVLDLGCGAGILVNLLHQNNFEATGIDSSKEVIEFARNNNNGNYEHTAITQYNTSKKFDVVVATQIIEHLRDPEDFLNRIHKLLKDDGIIILETPNLKSWNPHSFWRKRIGGMYYGKDHRIIYTPKSLTKLLGLKKFLVIKIKTKTYFPIMLEEIIESIMNRKQNKNNTGQPTNKKINVEVQKNSYIHILKKLFNFIKYSKLTQLIFYLPNLMTQINNKGNQIIIIAKKQSIN
ncbi:MAG: class I SAM-dependent methyltransferase [Patescibacteria group bacterium]